MNAALDYITDIDEAARKIEQYTANLDYEDFVDDELRVDAVLRNFEVIGEAAKNVPAEVRDEYKAVPWAEMAGMRDKLIHGYSTVELAIVWKTVEEEIPEVKRQIESIRDDLERK
ncbi:HepT-like ribonuclease domain-containing protein [Halodesulfurarchaeum sp.]|uniref:HepT-like ribonuclease domain-containing protein n=1 Tax=Halodesulfurarchaeum sp. TaxID=1980530 RepID=UPI002FC29398